MLNIEKNKRQLFRLVDALRIKMGAYNLYSNIVYLLFLKYVASCTDKLELSSVESYKIISIFKRKYDLARVGNEPLRFEDIYEVLSALDKDLKLGNLHFTDAAKNYYEMFSDESVQRDILRVLDEFDFDLNSDLLDDFFELVIQRCAVDVRKTIEFVTNKSLRLLAKQLLEVSENDVYLDCYSGFSSTLFDIENYGSYIGYEINLETALVSKMNLMIRQKNNYDIRVENFLEANTHAIADKVFSDGPISMVGNMPYLCNQFYIKTNDLDVLSIFKVFDSLKENGRAVITVPGKVLFSSSKGYIYLRKHLTENGLKAVVSLPSLWSRTAINTNLLVIEKGYNGDVEFIDAKNSGVLDRRFVTIPLDTIQKIAICIKEKANIPSFAKSVDYRDVICQGTWVPKNYIEVEIENNYREVKDIDHELKQLYLELKNNL